MSVRMFYKGKVHTDHSLTPSSYLGHPSPQGEEMGVRDITLHTDA